MFNAWGQFVVRHRKSVIAIMITLIAILSAIGMDLSNRLSQEGWFDPHSGSVTASQIEEKVFGRDRGGDVVVLYHAPANKTIDDPEWSHKVESHLQKLKQDHPDQIEGYNSYWSRDEPAAKLLMKTDDNTAAIASIELKGDGDDVLRNYRIVEKDIPASGVNQEIAGQVPVNGALDTGMSKDIKRAELIALPIVAVLLFFIFGGIVAAFLPLLVGVLSILGSLGLLTLLTYLTPVNVFAQSCVTLIGLGLAIDYGLFIVSRFREELADGFDVNEAVVRTVATAGRTVLFSAIMVGVSLSGLLLFPQGFLKSVAFGAMFAVAQAAILSITVLPAILAILGRRIDALSLPFMRKSKSKQAIENSFWARIAGWSMKHAVLVIVPIVLGLLALIIPFGNIQFGGINEKYLPPNNEARLAQEHFDESFSLRTTSIKVVMVGAGEQDTEEDREQFFSQVGATRIALNDIQGITKEFDTKSGIDPENGNGIFVLSAGVDDISYNARIVAEVKEKISDLKHGEVPEGFDPETIQNLDGTNVFVGGIPALETESVQALQDRLPWMGLYVVIAVTLLMFLAFGSLVLPIKATLMSLLGLGATLGFLTWIFIDGHFSSLLDFTPGPLMSPVLVLIMAIVFGLSTDYEVFLVSRMVEARAQGASTEQAIRTGIAHTGSIITAAAAILIVVTACFGFSDIVMMKYIAYGMIAALILDATIIRMMLVPATMKLLGNDNWWAPGWAKRLFAKIEGHEPGSVDIVYPSHHQKSRALQPTHTGKRPTTRQKEVYSPSNAKLDSNQLDTSGSIHGSPATSSTTSASTPLPGESNPPPGRLTTGFPGGTPIQTPRSQIAFTPPERPQPEEFNTGDGSAPHPSPQTAVPRRETSPLRPVGSGRRTPEPTRPRPHPRPADTPYGQRPDPRLRDHHGNTVSDRPATDPPATPHPRSNAESLPKEPSSKPPQPQSSQASTSTYSWVEQESPTDPTERPHSVADNQPRQHTNPKPPQLDKTADTNQPKPSQDEQSSPLTKTKRPRQHSAEGAPSARISATELLRRLREEEN